MERDVGAVGAADSLEASSTLERPWLRLYDDEVPAEITPPQRTVTACLDEAAERWPGSAAICYLGREITYRELRHDAELLSTCLARLGVGPGDPVALVLPNCPQLVIGLHAILRLGAVAAPLDPSWAPDDLVTALADCGAEVVLCLDRDFERVRAARDDPATSVREVIASVATDYLPAIDRLALNVPARSNRRERIRVSASVPPGAGARMWSEELRRARGLPVPAPGADDGTCRGTDPALLVYATPQAAQVLTVTNLLGSGTQVIAWLAHARLGREAVLVGLPLFTAEALTLCVAAGLLLGAALLLVPRRPGDPALPARDAVRPTIVVGARTLFAELLDDPDPSWVDLRSVRLFVTGPDLRASSEASRLEGLTGARVVDGLSVPGAPVVLGTPLRPSVHDAGRPGRVGIPLPSTEIRVVAPDGTPLRPGRPGRLVLRGPQVFAGFHARPDLTDQVLRDGWLFTDVLACVRDDGWVEVLGQTGST